MTDLPIERDLTIRRLAFDKVNPAEYNPRIDLLPGDREWQEIEASLDEFGLVEPLIWNEATGNLVGGHQRLKILKSKGRTEADFSIINEPDPDRERALNIRLNGTQGRWDVTRLTELIDSSADLQRLSGITDDDLADLNAISEQQEALGMFAAEAAAAHAEGRIESVDPTDRGTKVSDLVFPVTPEQRHTILDALATAKEYGGHPTSAAALVDVCSYFAEHATVEPGAED